MAAKMPEDQNYIKILEIIATCRSTARLKNFIENAERKNVPEVRDAAIRQLASLTPDYKMGTLEYDFWRVLRTYELILRENGNSQLRLYKTREKAERKGVEETLSDWVMSGLHQSVFETLIQRNMADLTGEGIILKHRDRFDQDIVQVAQERLNTHRRG